MKFKTSMINVAVAAALGTVAGAAQAVNLSADGQGQVLIYPYYTVQSKGGMPFDTYVTVVNSDPVNGKAVKVRFFESKNSQEVLDFNLYMSPNDVWTAAITRNRFGNPILRTLDNSCTVPPIPIVGTVGTVVREIDFRNYAYDSDTANDATMARAKEGYLEIIQMADLIPGLKNGDGLDTWLASKHVAGTPPNCASIYNSWLGSGYAGNAGVSIPTGGLSGAATIINVPEGTDISYDAVAVVDFTGKAMHETYDSPLPNLGSVNPKVSAIFDGKSMIVTDWFGVPQPPVVPVTAILMRNQLLNEYAVAAQDVGLGTDWVITMPTKRDHVAQTTAVAKSPFTSTLTASGACEAVTLTAYNREEAMQQTGLQFSTPQSSGNSLCWEVNVVSMKNGTTESNVLGGVTTRVVLPLQFSAGWVRMAFTQTLVSPVASTTRTTWGVVGAPGSNVAHTALYQATYTGLPVLGFMAQSYVNNSSLANYGSAFAHRYHRNITP